MQSQDSKFSMVRHLLPDLVRDMADSIGYEHALTVVRRLGGSSFRCPLPDFKKTESQEARENLISAVGCESAAHAFMREYQGIFLYIPRCAKAIIGMRNIDIHQEAEEALRRGLTMRRVVAQLATKHKITERQVWTILSRPSPAVMEA